MNAPKIIYKEDNDIIYDHKSAYWELNVEKRLSYWSTGFVSILGYELDDVVISLHYFLRNLVHENDRSLFRDNFYGFIENHIPFKQVIRVLTKNGRYHEFKAKTCNKNTADPNRKKIAFNKSKINTPDKLKDNHFYYLETAEMISTGSWYVDFRNQKSYWDRVTKTILGYPEDYIPSLKHSHKYYHKDYFKIAKNSFVKCAKQGVPFNKELRMITYKGKNIWVRAIGKSVYNNKRVIVGVRGVFQDIDDRKNKELKLEKTYKIISSQNSRLFNFAHIVSHNLRSHSSNLELIVQLINGMDNPDEKLEMIEQIANISTSLNTTIEHLNEIVTIQNKVNQKRTSINFEDTLAQVTQSINQIIALNEAEIKSDFSKIETIQYIPAYLESIILNLLTNAIKYRHPDRKPIISLKTFEEGDSIILEVSDNGLGIDMEKFGHKIFGMYKTFHYNKDAVGIGLFLTKSQIESLNGEIFVNSEVNKGTTFKIKF